MNIIIEIKGGNIYKVTRSISMIGDKIAVIDYDNLDVGVNPVSVLDEGIDVYSDITDVFPQDNDANKEIYHELKGLKFS